MMMAFHVPQTCIHCGKVMKLMVRSNMDGTVEVALLHSEWDMAQFERVTGFEDLVRIDGPKDL